MFPKAAVLRYFWLKSPAKGAHNINKTRPANVIECCLVGFAIGIGEQNMKEWMYNYGPTPAERTNCLDVPSVVFKVKIGVPPRILVHST